MSKYEKPPHRLTDLLRDLNMKQNLYGILKMEALNKCKYYLNNNIQFYAAEKPAIEVEEGGATSKEL